MSVEQTEVVDAIGVEKATGDVALVISDHLEWDPGKEHLLILQEKINTYLRFVESGEIFEAYPEARGRRVVLSLVAKHQPNGEALAFLKESLGGNQCGGVRVPVGGTAS